MEEIIFKKAEILVEALPYIQKYKGKLFVIKMGGSIFRNQDVKKSILMDVAFLNAVGINVLLVCGGGPFITEEIEKTGKKVEFIEGLRVTNKEELEIVVKVLGNVKNEIKDILETQFNTCCTGFNPEDRIVLAKKIHWQKGDEVIDLGYVGQITGVDIPKIESQITRGVVIIAPIGISEEGQLYNINGDSVSAYISQIMKAEKLIFLTSVPGIMRNISNPDALISILTVEQAEGLIKDNIIQHGMIPKTKACISSLKEGVKKTHIISGTISHALLFEIFTQQGIGTEIILSEQNE
ncbi:MAG: acetylglutamate kinase [Candidatus Omnitrophica bacterium]|nr:acetylglutamate kinase [Candidatus Omnitrophota bacterium]